ncbi:MAG: hypothetical protein PUC93_02265, partial [Oscillospiraceae bacterium]|nr:hypothetical protein [Oscillospiraceae bacterium]
RVQAVSFRFADMAQKRSPTVRSDFFFAPCLQSGKKRLVPVLRLQTERLEKHERKFIILLHMK